MGAREQIQDRIFNQLNSGNSPNFDVMLRHNEQLMKDIANMATNQALKSLADLVRGMKRKEIIGQPEITGWNNACDTIANTIEGKE